MYSLRSLISFEGKLEDAFLNVSIQQINLYADLTKPYFDYAGISEETLNTCNTVWMSNALYYYPDDGRPITSDNASAFPLDKSQTHMLKTEGILFQDDCIYSAVRLQDGWLYIQWGQYENIYNMDFQRIAGACPSALCIIENATGEILVSTGEQTYDFLDESRVTFDEKSKLYAADGIQAGYHSGKSPLSGVFFEKSRLLDRYSVFVYMPLRTVMANALWKTLPIHGLILLCFLFIWFCSRKLWEKAAAPADQHTCLPVGRRSCFSLSMMRHITPLLLAGVLTTSAIAAYLPLLTNYTGHNAKMEKNLQAFIKEIQLNDEEYVLWNLLKNADTNIMGELSDKSGFYAA